MLYEGPPHETCSTLLMYFQNAQFLEAENLALSLTQDYPEHQFAWKVLGAIYSKLGNKKKSLAANQKATKLLPNDCEAHNNLGNSFKDLNRLEEAMASYQTAISINSNYPQAFFNLGNVLNSLGKLIEAIESLKKAISINPNYIKAYNNLGYLYARQGSLQESEKCYRKSILLNPKDYKTHNNLGNTLKDLNLLEEAVSSYKKAIALKPDYPVAYYNLGNVFKDLNLLEEAVSSYKKAIALKPDYSDAFNNLGLIFEELRRSDEAEDNYKQAIITNPNNAYAHNNLGIILKSKGSIKEAEVNFIKAINLNPDYASAYYNLSAIKKFSEDDEHFIKMQNLYLNDKLKENDSCLINFGLAKAYEDLQKFELAFLHYIKGNELRKKSLNYNINSDIELFSKIKKNSELVFENYVDTNSIEISVVPIFIVGMPRSGTTLIEQIISTHTKVTGAGELLYIDKFGGHIAKDISNISRSSLLIFREKYLNELKKVAAGNLFVTDKLPQNFRFIGLIASAFPEAKIIHVQRNPASTCWANFKQYFSQKGLGYSYSLEDIVNYYNLYISMMKYWQDRINHRIYNLNYELLVENQEFETRKLIEHLNLEWDSRCLSPQENTKIVSTASSLQVRKKIYSGSSQQWLKFKPFLKGLFDNLL